MSSTSHDPTKHPSDDDDSSRVGFASSTATAPAASIEVLKAKASSLEMLRHNDAASEYSYPSTALSSSIAAAVDAYATGGSDKQTVRIPTKSENCEPGPTLNPGSCSSGLALLGGGGSLAAMLHEIENIDGDQDNSNEDWGVLYYPRARTNLFGVGNSDN